MANPARTAGLLLLLARCATPLAVAVDAPGGPELARHVDFVNRFGAVRNVQFGTQQQYLVVVDRSADGSTRVNALQRWRRNDYPREGPIAARDLVIFRSGALRGTGILVTDGAGPDAQRMYQIWLPALGKVRRVSEPDPRESWSGSNFTFGDIYVRRPDDEDFEILGEAVFEGCLGVLDLAEAQRDRFTQDLPPADCSVTGKRVYRVEGRPASRDLGYDRRILWIDVQTYADYRADYYQGDKLVKTIDKAWRSMGIEDPRGQYAIYWYARSHDSGQEGMAYVPSGAVVWNADLPDRLWSEHTLRQIRR